MRTPDFTPAQLVAFVPAAAALLDALGVIDIDRRRQRSLTDAVHFSAVLVVADAVMRSGRAVGFGRHLDATAQDQFPEPVIGDDADDDIEAIALADETG